jgi:3-methyladenine DNA glycosylase AlkD
MMKAKEARTLGSRLAGYVRDGDMAQAHALLAPVLAERESFAKLRLIAEPIGTEPLEPVNALLDRIAADKTMGGWVVIAKALEQQLGRDLAGALGRCQAFIIAADVWYGADTLGEGVMGEALVQYFAPTLALLRPWREHSNAWVRRAVGVSVHFWAKRSDGAAVLASRAEALLALLAPMFGEWDMAAVKGVGWGLKTLGRYYPDLVTDWLVSEALPNQQRYRALMLRKALTYLPEPHKDRVRRVNEEKK